MILDHAIDLNVGYGRFAADSVALSWEQLKALAPAPAERCEGPANAQATLRLFGQPESQVRVTLFRDHHAWCPYCQKVWLWLEFRRVPYRIRKVTMRCYGPKEPWFTAKVPSGMLPALELDGRLLTESDRILEALEHAFGAWAQGCMTNGCAGCAISSVFCFVLGACGFAPPG